MGRQRGAVMIMVLWSAVVMTILVTVLAANIRLSATTAFHNKAGNEDYAAVMATIHKAEMELMMERMPVPAGQEMTLNEDGEFRIPAYRFNGQPLNLNYAADDDMIVRIYDHAGKINLNRLERNNMQLIIEKRLGEGFDPRRVQELLAAWEDWTDLNTLMTPGGAEDQYYQGLETPYTARNVPEMDTVEELRLIRGFDELFADINLEAAFTIYGTGSAINPNLASREALLLLPGLDAELVEEIIAHREQTDFRAIREVGEIVPLEGMVELSPWLGFNTSSFYSVYAYPAREINTGADAGVGEAGSDQPIDLVQQAYMQIMEVRSFNNRARIYQVNPYARLPDTAPARVDR
jgi:general secretion pathway protein K